jgi:hypothetical protein
MDAARGESARELPIDRFCSIETHADLASRLVKRCVPDLDEPELRGALDDGLSMLEIVGVRVFGDSNRNEAIVQLLDERGAAG